MNENILTKISQSISASLTDDQIAEQIQAVLFDIDTLYSYLIRAHYKKDTLISWTIEYNFSQFDKYNTLKCPDIARDILHAILTSRTGKKSIVGYKQPDIELMLKLYNPLIAKLSQEQCSRWNELEYDDAVSMCQYVMLKLYRKGYYINKSLLQTSFKNYVLMELRHSRNKPEILSFEKIMHREGENGPLTLGEMLEDKDAELEAEKKQETEIFNAIFEEVKQIIIDFVGERQFEQLLRDYGNKHTTTWSRKLMQRIKIRLKKLGITWKTFQKYL